MSKEGSHNIIDFAERVTQRKISQHDGGSPQIGIGNADLSYLDLEEGDQVKVVVLQNEIRIVPLED